ncbi:ABC transporter ATP-binding protein [Anaerococcus tetradius]|uniref:ABC transporter, ATP-binding protein n=2 Tax=Anaerococcus tetradius TaxID=33036 RepID=C2CF62_9FIRM|nr:ABC transporter ATP-binding protein [Anaerococcus tetradius]EEI83820.1 ABC transporter, ATP-binding protein [Anaerococcus tetradius ATCC 35098]KWZ79028.1 ABC transporter, ATP-binding protein [Anaerococcus tetradius]
MPILELKNIKRIYKTKNITTEALKDINLEVNKGEFISIMGESGAGKTTLLNIIASLDRPTSGNIYLNGEDLTKLKDNELASFRRKKLGFVFQDFNLLDQFSNKDNIYLPLVLSDEKEDLMIKRLDDLKERLGIEKILDKYPYQISGGQKQRIAIARALITKPELLLADEPTGALDSSSSNMILDLFTRVNDLGQTVLMVTHSLNAASFAKRVLFIKDGVVFHELYKAEDESRQVFMERINKAQILLARGELL